ncbi:MAG TPA: hypothetical protein VFV73_27955 [Streptosporangiaceae bacterium]|nr:hypothetical protein [Streptosporangiaceae bacterium]
MTDIRNCDQCGAPFSPRREHARFCSARCRAAWNRHHAHGAPADTSALDWSITAMGETIGRLGRAGGQDLADGFAVISEAVWRVTIVDAALMRYHPETYSRVLASEDPGQRRIIEETFGGLRFVRNRMGYDTHPADLIQPLVAAGVAAWTWKPAPEPALGTLTPRGRAWEMDRYQAYQAQLAGQAVGETFTQAAAFLGIAADGILSHT